MSLGKKTSICLLIGLIIKSSQLKIEFLISTLNRTNLDFLKSIFTNLDLGAIDVLVINQCDKKYIDKAKKLESTKRIKIISVQDRGLSKSRNLALSNATGDICLIADDDIVYNANIFDRIRSDYQNSSFDIITYESEIGNHSSKKSTENSSIKPHNYRSLFSIISFQISFVRQRIIQKGLSFDTEFGIGSGQHLSGEENIFIKDAMDSGLFVGKSGFEINKHPDETNTSILTHRVLKSKGPLFKRMFNQWAAFFILSIFYLKKTPLIIKNTNFFNSFYISLIEMIKYEKPKK
jgi:glycosyltransferase involved in cell wall biosynthesis